MVGVYLKRTITAGQIEAEREAGRAMYREGEELLRTLGEACADAAKYADHFPEAPQAIEEGSQLPSAQLSERVLSFCLTAEDVEAALSDLEEICDRAVDARGLGYARVRLWQGVASLLLARAFHWAGGLLIRRRA
jgi:hypothetical protein